MDREVRSRQHMIKGDEGVDLRPRQEGAPIPTPPGKRASQGAQQGQEEVGKSFLPASIGTCSNGRAPDEDRPDPEERLSAMRQQRKTDLLPPLRQVPALGTGN